jgi:hypothetical protein
VRAHKNVLSLLPAIHSRLPAPGGIFLALFTEEPEDPIPPLR